MPDYITVAEDGKAALLNLERALNGEQFTMGAYSGEESSSRLFFEVTYNPIKNEKGRVIGVSIFARDLTERKKAEEVLKESEAKFRNLADQSPNMIFINQNGRIVYANRKCEEVTGYTSEELYSPGFNFLTLIEPDSKEAVLTSFKMHNTGIDAPAY